MHEILSIFQSKRNTINLVVLVVLVALIPLGIKLLKNRNIFFSQANVVPIALGQNDCVTQKDGQKVLQCKNVPLILISPLGGPPPVTPGPTTAPTTPPTPPPNVTPSATPVACNPRPNIGRTSVMGVAGLTVTLTAATNANTPNNPMNSIVFTSLSNGTVSLDGQVKTASFTHTVPAGTNTVTFLIKQVTYGQATNVNLTVKDTCGDYPLFFGGGTEAGWPQQLTVTTPAPTVAPTPAPVVCQPRPNIGRSAVMGSQGLTVNLTAGTNSNTPNNPMSSIRFTSLSNAKITTGGETVTAPFTYQPASSFDSYNFLITQVTKGQPTTVNLIIKDRCGDYPLFFGGGTSAGWP